jgi:membrane associated rhomboid family serine protease
MTHNTDFDRPSPPARASALALPLHNIFFTYALMGAIVIVWLLMELFGGSTNSTVLRTFGANDGRLILLGQTWRLFTSMFIHIGFDHLLANTIGLFIFGLEMERIFGQDRYIVIYILAGLFGNLASFALRGPSMLSAGASGAIFGIIGMNLAFFLIHRQTFGKFGHQRMIATLLITGYYLYAGFISSRVDNFGHIGGLIAGFAIGYGLAPRYDIIDRYSLNPRVVDLVSLLRRWWVPALAIVLLSSGVSLAISFWSGMLR